MKRGDVILIRQPRTPASKARPYVVVTRTSALDDARKVSACPLTSKLRGASGQRPLIEPTAHNNLRAPSEVEVDWIYTHEIEYVAGVIGSVDAAVMNAIDAALRRWLHL